MEEDESLNAQRYVLHIGAPKCGSTAIQSSLDTSRDSLKSAGFFYWSDRRHNSFPAREVAGTKYSDPRSLQYRKVITGFLETMVEDFRASKDLIPLYSSEYLASANSANIQRLVRDFSDRPLKIVYVVRAPHLVITSWWQQCIKEGTNKSLSDFFETILSQIDIQEGPEAYWQDQHFGRVAKRWINAGATDFSVVVIDPRDHESTLRNFEQAAGIPQGVLALGEFSNESVSLFEAEVLVALNKIITTRFDREVLNIERQKRGVERYIRHIRLTKGPSIEVPHAYRERVTSLAKQFMAELKESGAKIYGDLANLLPPEDWARSAVQEDDEIRISRADDAERAAGMLLGVALKMAEEERKYQRVWGSPLPTTPQLVVRFVRELARRVLRPLRRPRS